MAKRGAFIVIEGLDRSGKTTQTTLLHDRLVKCGISVNLYKFPDRTTSTGKMIDSYLRSQSEVDDRAIHLLFSANRWEAAENMIQELKSGITIVCDRYAFSGIAFSAAKALPPLSTPSPGDVSTPAETPRTLTYEWCRAPDTNLPSPDLVLFLDVSPEVQKSRGGYGEERYEKEDVQRRVRSVFRRIESEFHQESESGAKTLRWIHIDAGRTLDEVSEDIWSGVEPLTGGVEEALARLWSGTP
ncbi:uncharacterized protein EI90DRAFT_3128406 [Cantharellus anzutake]|uniref:uncharacterized protein n=1 Tax=Cantharellus anzutake TaxID=1750568 RepID=UPI001903918F|nr:uncharacterized protein EI90DRAFT_3128406 [Cantharellus anzutake]KAF8325876.1 hypothetical protein EI90DRAFT_3128406 [Cantharellus anzutake]